MKFLIDHNLSPKLVAYLQERFPGSVHTMALGFDRTSDHGLMRYAEEHGFHILTKDTDFEQLSLLRGAPPKVVWLRVGNASTRSVMDLLDKRHADILRFLRTRNGHSWHSDFEDVLNVGAAMELRDV